MDKILIAHGGIYYSHDCARHCLCNVYNNDICIDEQLTFGEALYLFTKDEIDSLLIIDALSLESYCQIDLMDSDELEFCLECYREEKTYCYDAYDFDHQILDAIEKFTLELLEEYRNTDDIRNSDDTHVLINHLFWLDNNACKIARFLEILKSVNEYFNDTNDV